MDSYYRITPRPITDRAFWEAFAAQPHLAPVLKTIRETCDSLPAQPHMPHATDYLAAKRSNDRARIDQLWQHGRGQLSALAMSRCLKGLGADDSDDRLLDWLWAFLTHPTWTVSAHLPANDLPASGQPVLDLASCEMAAVLAEMRECLQPWMDSVSGTLSDSIITEIDRRILIPYAAGIDVWWHSRFSNWLGVCAGNILAACESLAAQGHPRPKARQRALEGLQRFLEAGFTPDGECDEGLGYWAYGLGQAVTGLSRLSRAELGRNIDLARLRRVAEYPQRIHLSGQVFFSGNDAGLRGRPGMSYVPWLATACNSPWLSSWAASGTTVDGRSFPMLLRCLLSPAPQAGETPAIPDQPTYLPDQQVAILRTPTARGQFIVCLSGGHNAERHNHNDLGHFIVTLDDQIVVPDLGAPHYTADFFSGNRYRYLSASSRGHNCPVINGQEQREARDAEAKVLEWDPQTGRYVLDLTRAYPPEAMLDHWTRTLERDGHGFLVRDHFRTRQPNVSVVELLWSTQPISVSQATATLGPVCALVQPMAGMEVKTVDPKEHLLRDYSDPLYCLSAAYATNDRGELTVDMRLALVQGQ